MQIRVECPECGKSFQIPERFAGREGECSKCQAIFQIPEHAERVPETTHKAKPASPGANGAIATGYVSRSVRDAGVTEEIPVYSIEPSDEFDVALAPAAPPESPIFDITDADLLPDDDDLNDDAYSLDSPVLDFEEEDVNAPDDQPAVDARQVDSPARTRNRQPQKANGGQKDARRLARREAVSDEVADLDPASLSDVVDVDVLHEGGTSNSAMPVIRRRKSGEEHSDSELPSRRSRSPEKARPPADDDEPPKQRSRAESNPRQLAIIGGVGAVLLLGAFLYSHFSAPATPVLPVVLDGPAPPIEAPPSADGNDSEEKKPEEGQPEFTTVAEPEGSKGKPEPEGSDPSTD